MKKVRIISIVLVLAASGGGTWWYLATTGGAVAGADISASGFIEARDYAISPEIPGRIVSITAGEGDRVKAGATLVTLDDALHKAQLRQAEAAVTVAQAGLKQATAARDGAQKAYQNAVDLQRNPLELDARIIAAQGQLDLAETNLKLANERRWVWEREALQVQRDVARRNLENLLAIKADPQEINAGIDRARTALDTAEANLDIIKAQIQQALVAIDIIKVQLSRTVLASPVNGVVSSRNAEPGELATPGLPVLIIQQLEEVTLIIFVPEIQLGLVRLGQEARVSVDSYPGETFTGSVVFISPQAQFTPKNIQLKEERTKTVYAVKIRLLNPGEKLKAGMPADAIIAIST